MNALTRDPWLDGSGVRVRRHRGPSGRTLYVALAPGGPGGRRRALPGNGGLRVVTGAPPSGGARRLGRRLAVEMLLKHRLHHTGFSGAKLLVTGAAGVDEELLAWIAAVLGQHAGRLYTGADMGVTAVDMERLARLSPYVLNAVGSRAEPHASTAAGVRGAVEAWARGPVAGMRVLVHGAGKVGAVLAAELAAAGAGVLVHDRDPAAAEVPGCTAVRDWTGAEVDVFVPCSVSDLVDPALARTLRCGAVIGSANAVLADEEATLRVLAERGILYLPTPLVGAGAVIVDSIEYYAPEAFRLAEPHEVYAFVRATVGDAVRWLLDAASDLSPAALLRERQSLSAPVPVPGVPAARSAAGPEERFCGLRFAPAGLADRGRPTGGRVPDGAAGGG
ncbi:hypothetical protein [Streptomyces subrutilus]|uniref:hypothetical protein n=1 Tax=Streptomyces subrutilus TaxID=36818 RepID=UPI0033F4C62C